MNIFIFFLYFFLLERIMKYRRVLLKLSGEMLSGEDEKGIDFNSVLEICKEVKECVELKVEVGIVVGWGNFWRGRSKKYMDSCTSDHNGILATTMNSLALQDGFRQIGGWCSCTDWYWNETNSWVLYKK